MCLRQSYIFSRVIALIPLLMAFCSCNKNNANQLSDWDVLLYSPKEASSFSILGREGYKSSVIVIENPWQGADNVKTTLFVARDGETAPGGYQGQIIQDDAKRLVVMSSTYIALLDAMDKTDCIVGVSGMQFVANSKIQNRRKHIGDVGYDGNIDYELLLSLSPDLVLLYGIGGASQLESKLTQLDIPFMYVGDYLEESPLGKAEWIVPIAEAVGCRERGISVYGDIVDRYSMLRDSVDKIITLRPRVMLNTPWGDAWFMPSATSNMARLIHDAGGEYIYKRDTGSNSYPIDIEEAVFLTDSADFWINTGDASSLQALGRICPHMASAQCFVNGRVFNNTRRQTQGGGNDFFESSITHPDVVLRDLITIFNNGNDSLLYYYTRLK